MSAPATREVANAGGKTEQYRVRNGDTLMKIAFEKYGNVYRWREILEANKTRIANHSRLTPGMTLLIAGVEYIVIQRNGVPYLIRKNDTLVKISKSLYGTSGQWQSLWKNNSQLIRNPNKIYAGFTLYYKKPIKPMAAVTSSQREVSSTAPAIANEPSTPDKNSQPGATSNWKATTVPPDLNQ